MAKNKKLQIKEKFLNSVIHGNIKGINLPKTLKDLNDKEKLVLYWNNPQKSIVFFKDVSFVGEYTETPDPDIPEAETPDPDIPTIQIKENTNKE